MLKLSFQQAPQITIAIAQITDNHTDRRLRETSTVHNILQQLLPGAQLSHHSDGAPFLASHPHINISISHSRTLAAVAIGPEKCGSFGIDIESPRPQQLARVTKRLLSTADILSLDNNTTTGDILSTTDIHTNPQLTDTLLKAWTIKEAVYKAARTPALPLDKIHINIPQSTATACNRTYSIISQSLDGPILTLAIENPTPPDTNP